MFPRPTLLCSSYFCDQIFKMIFKLVLNVHLHGKESFLILWKNSIFWGIGKNWNDGKKFFQELAPIQTFVYLSWSQCMMARTGNFRVPWLVLLHRRLDQSLKGHLVCCKVPLTIRLAASGRVVMNMVTSRPSVPYSNPNSNLSGRKMLELVLNGWLKSQEKWWITFH